MKSVDPFKTHIDQFSRISNEDFQAALKYFKLKKIKKGTVLIRAGERVTHTFWVQSGMLISTFVDRDGKEHIIQFAFENCWVTDQIAFYNKEKAMFTISAVENSELLSISFEDREQLCADVRAMETFFRRKANDSFAKQQKRLLTYLTSEAHERLDFVMTESPPQVKRLPKKLLAAYVGVSRETLSRPKK
ncbi:MAG TPA: Crp/Fnr family transcriptional regulator [Cyclobacteriaceae bacterium]